MNSIDVLKRLKNLNDLELISSNVIMKDGSTVEDSIGNLKDDLITLQGDLSSNKAILEANINEIETIL